MEDSRNGFLAWIKAHKKQLFIAGISVVAVMGIAIALKNTDDIMELWTNLELRINTESKTFTTDISEVQSAVFESKTIRTSRSYKLPKEPVRVRKHIRKLSDGRQHSAKKAAEAAALGISLLPNQTLVDGYEKYAA